MLNLTCYAHQGGNAMFFDPRRRSTNSFEFTPYYNSKRERQWTLNILTGAYRPEIKREDLADTQFNLPKLAFVGFERVRAFDVPDLGSVGIRNWLSDAVARAYRSAESGVLDTDCDAKEVTIALARFYRNALGLLDPWPSTEPLPLDLSLLVGAPAPSRYEFLL